MDEPRMLRLVEEVLDAQLCDHVGEKIGRVDDLVLDIPHEGPPRVSAILIGGQVRARRVGAWMTALHHLLGAIVRANGSGTTRISFDRVESIGDRVQVDVRESDLESERLERWLRTNIVCHIPGAGGERK